MADDGGTTVTGRFDSWTGRVLLGVSATLLTLVLLGGVGECAVRAREASRATIPGTMPQLFYRHQRLRHAMVRSYDYYGWVQVNAFGFRGPDIALTPPDSVPRIMVVGASTTFDRGVTADDRAWPARMAHWLAVEGRPAEVINAGVPGYAVLDNLIRLQTELYRFQPDVLVLYHTHNDLFGALRRHLGSPPSRAQRPDEVVTPGAWIRWLERQSLLYAKVRAKWDAVAFGRSGGGGAPPRATLDTALARAERDFARDVSAFLAVASSLDIPVVVVGVVQVSGAGQVPANRGEEAAWRGAVPFADPVAVLDGYARFNGVLRAAAAQVGAPYVTPDTGLAGDAFYESGDPIHFNDLGADRFGRYVADALRRMGDSLPLRRSFPR